MRFHKFFSLIFIAYLLAFVGLPAAYAQEGATIQEIQVEFREIEGINPDVVLAHIKLQEGGKYQQPLVDQSIRSLYDTGLFDFIKVHVDKLWGNEVNVIFEVLPKYKISKIEFEGNSEISKNQLRKKIKTEKASRLDEARLKNDVDSIREFYRKKGYSQAKIDYRIEKNRTTGYGRVVFEVQEGSKIHIKKILFVGNEGVKSRTLLKQMRTSSWHWFSWFTGSGRVEEKRLQEDIESLREYYKNQGYLDVEIPESGIIFEYPKPGSVIIVIHVDEGSQYYVGSVGLKGNTLFPTRRLEEVLSVKTGDIFSPALIDADVETIRDFYGQVGYLDTQADAQRTPNLETKAIDLLYDIHESGKFYVESINIQGNTKTKSNVILRELALAPGDVFDLVRMKNSQYRLQNLGYFKDVHLSPEATNVPGRRNLRIAVKEDRTGGITFGVAASSVENFLVYAELHQSNFDLFNYRSFFQGGGQKFKLRFQVGARSNQVSLNFEEPWLFERELAFGFDVYRTETRYFSSVYDELRKGFDVYLRKHLFELVVGRLSYTLEQVTIADVDKDASQSIKNEEGTRTTSKLSFELERDTTDNFIYPSEGNRVVLLSELAGGPFGGNTKYYRLEARAGQWFPISKTHNQVLSIIGRGGTVAPFDGKQVPLFDRYFLGGPDDMRGFNYRQVGPKDVKGEPVGGNTYGFLSAEYSILLVDPIRAATFYDIGFVNRDKWSFNPSDYNDNWGVGLRIFIMGAPLRLDFGFPITSDDRNKGNIRFHFSFGTTF